MSWPSVMVVRLRNTDMSTTTQHPRGRQYIVALTRHARTWDAAAFLLGPPALPLSFVAPAATHILYRLRMDRGSVVLPSPGDRG
jgi:hypothetical protein